MPQQEAFPWRSGGARRSATMSAMRTPRLLAAVALCAAAGSLGACASRTSSVRAGVLTDPTAAGNTIVLRQYSFATVKVDPGVTVTVLNRDASPHALSAEDGSFDTGRIPGGGSVSFTAPTKPGIYEYADSLHTYARGTLIVQGPGDGVVEG